MAELEKITSERDALAAHVERLKEAGTELYHAAGCITHADKEWEEACEEAPETSLAKLKAQWQAEALEGVLTCCDKCPPGKSHKDVLRVVDQMARAQRDLIRRQAGGDV